MHAHAINAGPIFSRVGPSAPGRQRRAKKKLVRTGLIVSATQNFKARVERRKLLKSVMKGPQKSLKKFQIKLIPLLINRGLVLYGKY